MKKVFLLSLGLILGLGAFAQRNVVIKNDAKQGVAKAKTVAVGNEMTTDASSYAPQAVKSAVINRYDEMEDGETMWTHYDLQSNQYVANRMYQLPNGNVAVTATMSHEANQTASDRGTGYNFYSNGEWDDQPETRVEPFKTGWPSIAQFGANGEILLAHGNGHMQCFVRTTAGQGDWTYVGALPDYPDGYAYTTEYPTWPRIVTCGENHNIAVAVAVLQHSISSDETDLQTVMWRSEDPANIDSWTVSYGPLHETGWDHNQFSADDYCMAANGHNVALMYSGCLTNSVWMFKSTDDGATWTSTRVWENPYEGREFDEEPAWGMEDTLFMPMNGSIVIDNAGTVHVALNTFEMAHTLENEPGYYTYWSGRAVDGILYWNDTQEAPMQSPDGNPHHAARLWWPAGEDYVHMEPDSTRWIGFIPMYEGIDWSNDLYYMSGSEYISKFYGASGHPALSCDADGNLACAFSSPCTNRTNGTYYFRSIYVSYRDAEKGYWEQDEDDLMEDVMLMYSEGVFTSAVQNTVNNGEFWFSYQADDEIGFYWGSNATQAAATENIIHGVKVIRTVGVEETEAQDAIYSVYPNPAKDYVVVSSAMDVNATITFVNLAGQTVKSFNQNLTTGENTVNIDIESGVYFCTINANGFNKTVKVVVK
ncbi:MAG: T9SS type A sorting domain-containing protein [Bacteroidales bacterium]|nr:T9SS type A sorting domain-containing protein [Bacteroidales bacterium]